MSIRLDVWSCRIVNVSWKDGFFSGSHICCGRGVFGDVFWFLVFLVYPTDFSSSGFGFFFFFLFFFFLVSEAPRAWEGVRCRSLALPARWVCFLGELFFFFFPKVRKRFRHPFEEPCRILCHVGTPGRSGCARAYCPRPARYTANLWLYLACLLHLSHTFFLLAVVPVRFLLNGCINLG